MINKQTEHQHVLVFSNSVLHEAGNDVENSETSPTTTNIKTTTYEVTK